MAFKSIFLSKEPSSSTTNTTTGLNERQEKTRQSFMQFTKELSSTYFTKCGLQLQTKYITQESLDQDTTITAALFHSIRKACIVFMKDARESSRIVPELHLSDRATEIVEASIRFQVNNGFQVLQQSTIGHIHACYQEMMGSQSRGIK